MAMFAETIRHRGREAIQELYVEIQGLIDFVEVNRTGFRKALKKHDKVPPSSPDPSYTHPLPRLAGGGTNTGPVLTV